MNFLCLFCLVVLCTPGEKHLLAKVFLNSDVARLVVWASETATLAFVVKLWLIRWAVQKAGGVIVSLFQKGIVGMVRIK